MSKTFGQQQLVAIGKTRAAKRRQWQHNYEFRRRGADVRLAHTDCASLRKVESWFRLRRPRQRFPNPSDCWLQTEVSPPNAGIGPRLDGDWTATGRVNASEPLPIRAVSLPSCFRWESEKRSRNSSDGQRCSAIGPCGTRLGGPQAKSL